MTVTVAQFRADFPAFASTTSFPDTMIQFWLNLAGLLIDPIRWDTLADAGTELFVAHNCALELSSNRAGAAGQTPGQVIGAVTAGSVDKVSYSRDVSQVMELNAGHWNATTYGQRYIRLARLIGMGPVQVGVPTPDDIPYGAWAGPWQYNSPNPS